MRKTVFAVVVLAGIAAIVAAQFSIPTLFDADGYLHIRMAEFLRRYGIMHGFHWARYSVFAQQFADKDFLYHLFLIPLTYLPNLILGAKIAACLFAVAFFLSFVWCLKKYCLAALVPVYTVMLFLSASFLQTLSKPRPMVLMFLLTLFFTHALIQKKTRYLFFISLGYALTHVSSPLLILFAVIGEAVRYASEGVWSWRTVRAVLCGVAVGFVVHPNFPNNLLVFYLNGILVPQFALKWGLELGAEFFPLDMRTFILEYPCAIIALGAVVALGTTSVQKISTGTRIWLALASFFFLGAFFSRRYILHSYPMLLIASGAFVTDWWRSGSRLKTAMRFRAVKVAAIACCILICARLGINSYNQFRQLARAEKAYNGRYEAAAAWMNANIPAGELVFHANWSDSQYFIGLSPQHDYFVTLDPIYMYYWNPQKYNLYRTVAFGREADPYTVLKDSFGVRYGYVGKDYFMGLVTQVKEDPRFQVMAEDASGLFFMLKGV